MNRKWINRVISFVLIIVILLSGTSEAKAADVSSKEMKKIKNILGKFQV